MATVSVGSVFQIIQGGGSEQAAKQTSKPTIDFLRGVLESAERGEILSAMCIVIAEDDCAYIDHCGEVGDHVYAMNWALDEAKRLLLEEE